MLDDIVKMTNVVYISLFVCLEGVDSFHTLSVEKSRQFLTPPPVILST